MNVYTYKQIITYTCIHSLQKANSLLLSLADIFITFLEI